MHILRLLLKVKNAASGTSEKNYPENSNQIRDMDFRAQVSRVEVLVGYLVGVGWGVGENRIR